MKVALTFVVETGAERARCRIVGAAANACPYRAMLIMLGSIGATTILTQGVPAGRVIWALDQKNAYVERNNRTIRYLLSVKSRGLPWARLCRAHRSHIVACHAGPMPGNTYRTQFPAPLISLLTARAPPPEARPRLAQAVAVSIGQRRMLVPSKSSERSSRRQISPCTGIPSRRLYLVRGS